MVIPTKRANLIAKEEQRRAKVEDRLERDQLKDQAYYVPLKQLKPLAKQIGLGDVSSLNEVEGRRMLKDVRSEINKKSGAETKISKIDASDKKEKAISSEKDRASKALNSLKAKLANRVQRSANPRWWHSWL